MTVTMAQRGLARSAAMQDVIRSLQEAIPAAGGVLVTGESGSGRELIARAIHHAKHDEYDGSVERLLRTAMRQAPNGRPFVVIDCASGVGLERQLFGACQEGAEEKVEQPEVIETGSAVHRAIGGTLVLRHMPELAGRVQMRLARVLRDGEAVLRDAAGEARVSLHDIRPIAIVDEGHSGLAAPELLKRLTQTRIVVPPLRQRREDIPALVRYLLADICGQANVPVKSASSQAVELLSALPWRGNVRELRELTQALVARTTGRLIRLADVLANVRLDGGSATLVYTGTLREARERFERDYVQAVLEQHRGRMAEAAKALGLQRTNLYRKVRQLSVKRRSPRASLS